MSAEDSGNDQPTPKAPGFYYRLLYESIPGDSPGERVPDLADPQLAWLRPIFAPLARYAMIRARIAVVRWQHPMLDVEHVLLGIVEATPPQLFAPGGPSRDVLVAALEAVLPPGEAPPLEAIPVTDAVRHMVELAREEARERGYDLIGIGPLLLGLTWEAHTVPSEVLAQHGITYASLRADLSPAAFVD